MLESESIPRKDRWVQDVTRGLRALHWLEHESRCRPLYLAGVLRPVRFRRPARPGEEMRHEPDPTRVLRRIQHRVVRELGEEAAPWPLERCPLRFRGRTPEGDVLVLLEVRDGKVIRERWLPFSPAATGPLASACARVLRRWKGDGDVR